MDHLTNNPADNSLAKLGALKRSKGCDHHWITGQLRATTQRLLIEIPNPLCAEGAFDRAAGAVYIYVLGMFYIK